MQVQHVELGQGREVLDAPDAVLAQHEHAQRRHGTELRRHLLDGVVVQIQEDQVGQMLQMVDFRNVVLGLLLLSLLLSLPINQKNGGSGVGGGRSVSTIH